jgi:phi13 family phage major tail protein
MTNQTKGTNRIALRGFSRLTLFPVLENTLNNYEVGEGFDLPFARTMTRDADISHETIYADDQIYLDLKTWNGLRTTITLVEMELSMLAKLGFGTYDEQTNTLSLNPGGINKEFALTFACERTDGQFRMYKMFSFVVNEVSETDTSTKGEGSGVSNYQISGTFTGRKIDNLPSQIHDGSDLDWLKSV